MKSSFRIGSNLSKPDDSSITAARYRPLTYSGERCTSRSPLSLGPPSWRPITRKRTHPPANAHRRLAEVVIKAGGSVKIIISVDSAPHVTKLADLPDRSFMVRDVSLVGCVGWNDSNMPLFDGIHYLQSLSLNGTAISDANLFPLTKISLAGIDLAYTKSRRCRHRASRAEQLLAKHRPSTRRHF